jgi:hypothetical protein
MAYTPPTSPTPGEAQPGQLLVVPDNRTIWLGVDATVDPGRSLLVSDIAGLLASDDEVLTAANEYTDAVALTRAPASHTHTASQITDFNAAANAAVGPAAFMRGMVILWYGDVNNIGQDWSPTGQNRGGLDMRYWALCDGLVHDSYQTPLLIDKFVLGAGSTGGGTTGGGGNIVTDAQGYHNHGDPTYSYQWSGNTVITQAMMPSHKHTWHKNVSGWTAYNNISSVMGVFGTQHNKPAAEINDYILTAGTNTTNDIAYATMDPIGGDQGHRHQLWDQPAHAHNITSTINNVPWIKMVYIVRTR